MAITSAVCNSFKQELLGGIHDLDTDVIKLALYTSAATLGASTTAYTTSNEVVGAGYTAGGNTLSGAVISLDGSVAIVDFSDTTWGSATITARGALIYNSSKSNRAIAAIDFGGDKTSTSGDFTVVFPAATGTNAIVRIN
jgi:hypothetical protein